MAGFALSTEGQQQMHLEGLLDYVDLHPPRANDREEFLEIAVGAYWDLVVAGIIVPGKGQAQPNFPWFRVTDYGRRVLADGEVQPHDRLGYITRLKARVSSPDQTVIAYLDEGLETFERGNSIAAMVMLGIAAERVFLLLCEAVANALVSPKETKKFTDLLGRFPMKPKLDWVHEKFRLLQAGPSGFPENALLMIVAIYDLMRAQRNDLGHPRERPPAVSRGDAHANFLIFPAYYEAAERVRSFLAKHQI